MASSVTIVGGGFSGAATAIALLARPGGPAVTLIEPDARAGPGLAYGRAGPVHLLNVRASSLGAHADRPGEFAAWWRARHADASPHGFAPRTVFGAYMEEALARAVAAAPGRFVHVRGRAVAAAADGGVTLHDGRYLPPARLVVALGHAPPDAPLAALAGRAWPAWVADPWAPGWTSGLRQDAPVMLLGTGLTMVDMLLTLRASGFAGRVLALSRRGLLPRAHAAPGPPAVAWAPPQGLVPALGALRRRARCVGWHAAVDGLRAATPQLWRGLAAHEQRRFARHAAAWWDVHRHRLAPEVAARLAAEQARGGLVCAAGRLVGVEAAGGGLKVRWRPRGGRATAAAVVQRLVNCTGPGTLHPERTAHGLLRGLARTGLIRLHASGLGPDADEEGRPIGHDGRPADRLWLVGPLMRAQGLETTAVPEIRDAAARLAHRLAAA